MEDKELLEMSAKAAGYSLGTEWDCLPDGIFINGDYHFSGVYWNPLTDDGDALRLAVKLGLSVERNRSCVQVSTMPTAEEYDNDERGALISSEPLGVGVLCPHKATRRAITRAAAQIGKEME